MNKKDFAIGFVLGVVALAGVQNLDTYLDESTAPVVTTPSSSPTASCDRPLDKDSLSIKVNEYRINKQREQLASSDILDTYAQLRAEELASNKDVTHESKYGGYYRWAQSTNNKFAQNAFRSVSEIITGPVSTPCQAVDNYAKSLTHEQAMSSDKFEGRGIGIKDGYVVVLLGDTTF